MAAGIWIVGLFVCIVLPTEGILLLLLSIPPLRNHGSILNFALSPEFIISVQLLALVILLARGFASKISLLGWLFKNRLRLATVFFMSIWIACLQTENFRWLAQAEDFQTQNWSYVNWVASAWGDFVNLNPLIFSLVILLIWLMPTQNRKTPKRA
jgi:hypothetical protein